ncbi:hypothetical protein ABZ897_00710 [Nonomuraea sp. NPDC046802]|uniref:hypothetical protein n=1 Tax=Nonomuraea sp. NPDC046802 TaxID=3154919 RepID=UPI0033E872F7
MPNIPEEAVRAAAEAVSRMLFSGQPEYGTWMEHDEALARTAVEAAAPRLAAQVRRETAEHIAAAILRVDTVEWALAGQRAGQDAAEIARKIGDAHDSR